VALRDASLSELSTRPLTSRRRAVSTLAACANDVIDANTANDRVLIIPVEFPDLLGEPSNLNTGAPINATLIQGVMNATGEFFARNSGNQARLTSHPTIAPLIRLPNTTAVYAPSPLVRF
jgi:hypothetical protein